MIIDDPFKDREDADSELTRERVWRWYHAVFRTRLAPNGVIIVICTRWHDDDLAGRLLAAQDEWEVLSIPAEAGDNDVLGRKKGEFLSECRGGARYSREDYADLKKNMPPYEWASLFQQNPTPDEGIYFQKDWFQTYENIPWGVTTYVTADLSYTDKNTSDYAVVCAWDIDSDGNWYLKDMWRNKATPDVTASIFVDFCRDFKPVEAILEKVDDNFGGPLIRKLLEERGVNAYITTVSAAGHKEQKATSYRAQLSRGKVFIPQKFWTEDFISEHLRFPNGKHDDMVDNGSLLGRHMDIIRGGTVKTSKTRNNPNSGDNIIKSLRDMQPKAKVRLA